MDFYSNTFKLDENGKPVLVSSTKMYTSTKEQQIAEKEAKLLEIYAELEALKQKK